MIAVRVVVPFVVLSQEVDTVVAAIGRPDQGVDVMARWDLVVENDPRMMVELDQNDGAVYPIVERAIVAGRSHPRKPGLVEMLLHVLHLYAGMAVA